MGKVQSFQQMIEKMDIHIEENVKIFGIFHGILQFMRIFLSIFIFKDEDA